MIASALVARVREACPLAVSTLRATLDPAGERARQGAERAVLAAEIALAMCGPRDRAQLDAAITAAAEAVCALSSAYVGMARMPVGVRLAYEDLCSAHAALRRRRADCPPAQDLVR